MRLALMLGLSFVMLACPGSFKAENPPCFSNADCSVEELGSDFPDHVCRDDQCYPSASAPSPNTEGDAGEPAVYDAGLAADTGRTIECRQDDDCDEGEICEGGSCFPSGVPPQSDAAFAVDSGGAGFADAGTPGPDDSGAPPPPDVGGEPTPPDAGGEPMLPDVGGGPMLPDAELPLTPDAE